MKKRMICLFLCLVMVLGLVPTAAAESGGTQVNLAREEGAAVTADHSTTFDIASHLNDGIISAREGSGHDAGPKNLWNNWAASSYPSADVTIDLGKVCNVTSMKWYAFADGAGTALPAKIEVQVPDNTEWKTIHTVENASASGARVTDLEYTQSCYNNNALYLYEITLSEPAVTQKLRLHLTAQTGKALGASEWEVYGTVSSTTPTPEPEDYVNMAPAGYGTMITASYTNPGDSVASLNNDIISACEGSIHDPGGIRDKWSSWKELGKQQTIIATLDGEQTIGRVEWFATYDGGGTQKPESIVLEALVNNEWRQVASVSEQDGVKYEYKEAVHCTAEICKGEIYQYTLKFNAITTAKLRLTLQAKSGACVGASELQIWGKYQIPNGFNFTLGDMTDDRLPVNVLVNRAETDQTLYLKSVDGKGTEITSTITIAAGNTSGMGELSLATLSSGEITVTVSLSQDYANAKTKTTFKKISNTIIDKIYEEVKTPYEYDVIVKPSGVAGDWDGSLVDNPNVFTVPGDSEYVYMTYVGHDGTGYRTGIARSKDLLTWEKIGLVLDNGAAGAWDEYNAAGYIVRDHTWGEIPTPHIMKTGDYAGQYVMTYLASDTPGYEAGLKQEGVAFTEKIFNENGTVATWTRYPSPILSAKDNTFGYEKGIIWKMQAFYNEDDKTYYGFYNTATGPEVTAGATSMDMIHWTRMEQNPLIVTENGWGTTHNADPDTVKINVDGQDYWVMFYFTDAPGKGIIDSFAVSTDLVNWQKSYMPLTTRNSTWSSTYAHKPCVVKHNGVVYHYYCAVGNQGRVIAVDTSIDLTILKEAQAIDTSKLTDLQKNLLETAISDLQNELLKENGSLKEVEAAVKQLKLAAQAVTTKAQLTQLYYDNMNRKAADYETDSWAAFAAALESAKQVIGNENATETEISTAYQTLLSAVQGLKAAEVTSIAINSTTHKTEFFVGDTLDVTNLTIEASYNSGTKETVNVTADMVTGFDSTTAGEKTLTITYEGKTTTYEVTVTRRPAIIRPGNTTSKPTNSLPFTDVNKSDRYYEDIKYVYENGLMNGVGDNKFAPNATLTRAMVVTTLYRMEGEPSVQNKALFSDVENSQWYTKGVEWAASKGIVLGYGDGKFGPNDPVTREQLATILYRYAQFKNYTLAAGSSLTACTDASGISDYAVSTVKWSVAESLLESTDGKLFPRENATRAEVAHALASFCQNVR